ncbi:MAG: single-strand DNA-binding protein [Frankiaceae bacterium]|jgi:single-strand DNA-binding protein|nr:single-strand DNA-binding protein [Frankiaceae bacterium]
MEPQIQMQGNLVADPIYRVTAGGLHMTKFRIASSGRRFDRSRNDFVNTDPVYMSVVCWRQLADNVAKSLRKGDTVLVHGRLTFREYDDSHGGPRRQAYEVDAWAVGPDLARYITDLTRPTRELEPVAIDATPTADAVPGQPTNAWDEPDRVAADSAA